MGLASKRPSRFLRWMFRVPLHIQNMGLGGWERLLGIRFMKITTKGRLTGKPHTVLVDILEHDKKSDVYYVQSAYGERADWVKNIKVQKIFEAQLGRRKIMAIATRVPRQKTSEVLIDYIENHKRYAKTMMRTIGINLDEFSEDELRIKLEDEVVLAIKPVS